MYIDSLILYLAIFFLAIFILAAVVSIIILIHKVKKIQDQSKSNLEIINKSSQKRIQFAYIECEKRIRSINEQYTIQIEEIKTDYKNQINHLKNNIESRKEMLSTKTEKELLMDIMITLSNYSTRFDKLDSIIPNMNDILNNLNGFQYSNALHEKDTKSIIEVLEEIHKCVSDKYSVDTIPWLLDMIQSDIYDVKSSID